jgi:hypothetical protein
MTRFLKNLNDKREMIKGDQSEFPTRPGHIVSVFWLSFLRMSFEIIKFGNVVKEQKFYEY